jgi:serine/threonine protein phosphatase 1
MGVMPERLPQKPAMPSQITQLTYAIGDIHGYDDLFAQLLSEIRTDAEALGEKPRIVLLGDYVDRGPSSRQVLDRILALEQAQWCDLVAVMGNHEDAIVRFLDEPESGEVWRTWGGAATLASYGVDMPFMANDAATWQKVRDAFAAAIDPAHLALLYRMPACYQSGDYLFVHAGVDPERPLAEQGPETFMYIRGAFLQAVRSCDLVVVHGHTPEKSPTNMDWRIGVDTGIYFNGTLSCVRLKGTQRYFLKVQAPEGHPAIRLSAKLSGIR